MWRRIANATWVAARVVNAQGLLVVMSKSLSLISIPLALGEQGNAVAWLLTWLVFCRLCLFDWSSFINDILHYFHYNLAGFAVFGKGCLAATNRAPRPEVESYDKITCRLLICLPT